MKKLVYALLFGALALNAENVVVKITKDIPYININDSGVNVKIQRIQDTNNRLADDFTRTSRVCPPNCIQPIKLGNGVKTISELELINFIKNKVYKKKGILVDARLKNFFLLETIPGAINIPYTITEVKSKTITDKLFRALGAVPKGDGSYDFTNAKELAVFCGGLWSPASSTFIKNIVAKGYPTDKIKWYRGGLQAWKLLGLTTVVHEAKEAK